MDEREEEEMSFVVGGPTGYIPGSIQYDCATGCGRKPWLAPSGQRFVKLEKAHVLCGPCALEGMKGVDPEDVSVELVPDALDEVKSYYDS